MSEEKIFDVIIIGAGPAGLTCAIELGKSKNLSVLLIDKQKKPGLNNSCAGGISEGIVKKYNIPEIYIQRTRKYEVFSKNKYYGFKLKNNSPILTTIRRESLDGHLYELTKKYGNIFFELNTNVFDIKKNRTKYLVRTGKKGIKEKGFIAKYIVFADGPITLGRRFGLGIALRTSFHIAFSGYSTKKEKDASIIINRNEWGYAWHFPHVNDTNIGYVILLKFKKKYLEKLKYFKEKLSHFTTGLIPTKLAKRFFKNNIYIIGDAAGLVNPITGGGLIYAFISGALAGKSIIRIFKKKGENYNLRIYFSKVYLWLIFMHVIYRLFHFLYLLGIKNSFLYMFVFYFNLMKVLFSFTKRI